MANLLEVRGQEARGTGKAVGVLKKEIKLQAAKKPEDAAKEEKK